jgi:hypothetical protein
MLYHVIATYTNEDEVLYLNKFSQWQHSLDDNVVLVENFSEARVLLATTKQLRPDTKLCIADVFRDKKTGSLKTFKDVKI